MRNCYKYIKIIWKKPVYNLSIHYMKEFTNCFQFYVTLHSVICLLPDNKAEVARNLCILYIVFLGCQLQNTHLCIWKIAILCLFDMEAQSLFVKPELQYWDMLPFRLSGCCEICNRRNVKLNGKHDSQLKLHKHTKY